MVHLCGMCKSYEVAMAAYLLGREATTLRWRRRRQEAQRRAASVVDTTSHSFAIACVPFAS